MARKKKAVYDKNHPLIVVFIPGEYETEDRFIVWDYVDEEWTVKKVRTDGKVETIIEDNELLFAAECCCGSKAYAAKGYMKACKERFLEDHHKCGAKKQREKTSCVNVKYNII